MEEEEQVRFYTKLQLECPNCGKHIIVTEKIKNNDVAEGYCLMEKD